MAFKYYNLRTREQSGDINLLFPGWNKGNECVAVLSPHDDDAVLGAGYAIKAVLANGAEVYVFIMCKGDAGYSHISDKHDIVKIREDETVKAYGRLGIAENNIYRFDYFDFSLGPRAYRFLPDGQTGVFESLLERLRSLKITRLLIPNSYREHTDHAATHKIGVDTGPQAGDPILVHLGDPFRIESYLVYSVWSDFSPEDSLVHSAGGVRANRAITAPVSVEENVRRALEEFTSQDDIISDLSNARDARVKGDNAIEVYIAMDPRPKLNYKPYWRIIDEIG